MSLDDFFKIVKKGGPGSGNFGHSGVPGHRGGSAAQGGAGGGMSSLTSEDYHKELKAWKSPIKVGKKIESEEEYEQAKKVFSDLQSLIDNRPEGYDAPDRDRGPFSLYFKLQANTSTLTDRIEAYERRTGKKKFKPDRMVHGRGGHLQ